MTLRRAVTLTLLALSLAGAAHAAGVDPRDATPVQREQAQARFIKGKQRYDAGDYTNALVEFKGSLDIVQSPNTRLYVARCYREMGRLVEAYVELGRTAVEAKEHATVDNRYDKARDAATAEREAVGKHLGFVRVTVQNAGDDTKLVVGGNEIAKAAWQEPAPVMPGNVEVLVTTPNRDTINRTVPVRVGERAEITIDAGTAGVVAPPPPTTTTSTSSASSSGTSLKWLRPVAIGAAGVGVVGFVMLIVAGPMSQSTYSSLQKQCGSSPCPPSLAGTVSKGRTEQTVANAGLAMGIIGVALGGALFGLSFVGSSSSPTAASAPAARVVLGPGSIGLEGEF